MSQSVAELFLYVPSSGSTVDIAWVGKRMASEVMMQGGCHCGAVRYVVRGAAILASLCHCEDCRKHSGAPVVGWGMFRAEEVEVLKGDTKTYASSEHGRRAFCPHCGTGLFYSNADVLPGLIDIQLATLDDPDTLRPQHQVQVAERITWMRDAQSLPEFERFPPL